MQNNILGWVKIVPVAKNGHKMYKYGITVKLTYYLQVRIEKQRKISVENGIPLLSSGSTIIIIVTGVLNVGVNFYKK